MEEKKLTDEEIIKAFNHCANNQGCIGDECPLYNTTETDCVGIIRNLTNRLQSEKKELDESCELFKRFNDKLNGVIAEQKAEIERLHKVLQEEFVSLKAVKAAEISPKAMKMLVESVGCVQKDTAKEIFDWLKSKVIMTEIPHGSEPSEEDVEAVMWWQIEEHFKKRYGLEVE